MLCLLLGYQLANNCMVLCDPELNMGLNTPGGNTGVAARSLGACIQWVLADNSVLPSSISAWQSMASARSQVPSSTGHSENTHQSQNQPVLVGVNVNDSNGHVKVGCLGSSKIWYGCRQKGGRRKKKGQEKSLSSEGCRRRGRREGAVKVKRERIRDRK